MTNFSNILGIVFSILSLIFFVRVTYRAFFFLWLFQLKEYRLDRLLVHFWQTKEGRKVLFSKRELVLWFLFFTPFLYGIPILRQPYVVQVNLAIIFVAFSFEAKELFNLIKSRQFRKPVFTPKAILITIPTIVIIFLSCFPLVSPIQLIFIDRLAPFLIGLFVGILVIPSFVAKTIIIMLAKRKRRILKDITVVGVTGSFGKSSTKELIADFLSEKYNVLKTPGSVNTELGIAQFMLKNLTPKHEIFVVEIGAYKRGEIKAVCRFVKPTIGVLTGINEQHLALFGSLDNTKKAKFELIESLPQEGMAFFNGDDQIAAEMSKWSKVKNTHLYSTKNLPRSMNGSFLSNIAAAYMVAKKLGVGEKVLQQKLKKSLSQARLQVVKKGSVGVFDDSFNTNPAGFRVALDALSNSSGKKVLVTPGIIELGEESTRIHTELGEKIGTICDVVILTNDNFEQPLREGLEKTKFDMKNFLIPKREELTASLKKQLGGQATVLLEGRVPKEVFSLLSS